MEFIRKDLEVAAYRTDDGKLLFGAGTPAGVEWVERTFPWGTWQDDCDGRPLFVVGQMNRVPVAMGEED